MPFFQPAKDVVSAIKTGTDGVSDFEPRAAVAADADIAPPALVDGGVSAAEDSSMRRTVHTRRAPCSTGTSFFESEKSFPGYKASTSSQGTSSRTRPLAEQLISAEPARSASNKSE